MFKALDDVYTISEAVQQALLQPSLKDSISHIIMWEECRKNKSEFKESCYGTAVGTLLLEFGIDINRIGRK